MSRKYQRRRLAPAPSKVCAFEKCSSPIIDPVSDQDQLSDLEWFELHPEANQRIRDAFPDELDDETARLFEIGVTRRAASSGEISSYIMRGFLR